jgi:hypothetical protein
MISPVCRLLEHTVMTSEVSQRMTSVTRVTAVAWGKQSEHFVSARLELVMVTSSNASKPVALEVVVGS